MRKILIGFGIVGLCFLSAFSTRVQSAAELAEAIVEYFNKRPMEKVFLHLDKPYYSTGDELWYAAYVNDYLSGTPSNLSEILHLELFDNTGKSIMKKKALITNGFANGVLEIPDTLSANYYSIKAYTNWSRNFEEGLLFNHTIKIVSANYTPSEELVNNDIQFYPEGGNILYNKLNIVSFTSIKNVKAKAYLLNSESDTLDDFMYDGKGFGLLRLIPKPEEGKYFLKFENDDSKYQLPISKATGTTLRLQEKGDAYNLFLEGSEEYFGKNLSIIILNNGNVVSAFDRKLDRTGLFLVFRKKDVPVGLNHLMVFSGEDELLNQRLFMNASNDSLISIQMKETFQPRDKIDLDIISNYQAVSNVSLSVTPVQYFSHAAKPKVTNMSQKFLLGEKTYTLNEYLIAESIGTYKPNSIIERLDPVFDYKIQRKYSFHVDIDIESNDHIQKMEDYSISIKNGDSVYVYFTKRRKANNLSLVVPSFNGVRDLIVKPYGADEDAYIDYTLKNSIGNEPLNDVFSQSKIETEYAKKIRENKTYRRLYGIDSKVKKESQKLVHPSRVLDSFDEEIVLSDYITLPNMMEVFKEIMPCSRMRENKDGSFYIQLCDKSEQSDYETFMENEPFRMIDGVPVQDSKVIADLKPSEIHSMNMIFRNLTLDSLEMDGILYIVTKEGDYGKTSNLGQGVFAFQGFSDEYSFHTPEVNLTTPDFRSTLYWNPQLEVEKNQPTKVSFPASDETGKYKVEIQGITLDGKPIYCETYFTVFGGS